MLNLDYLPKPEYEGHMPPSKEVCELWRDVRSIVGYDTLLEIGLNAGHSSAINLELFPTVHVTSVDIGRHDWTELGANVLKTKFHDRFNFVLCHSTAYFERVQKGEYEHPHPDTIFIDGGHDISHVINDIRMGQWMGCKYLIIDDIKSNNVKLIVETLMTFGVLKLVKEYRYKCANTSKPNNAVGLYKCQPIQ